MRDVEIYLDHNGKVQKLGLMRRHAAKGRETLTFEYDADWIARRESFTVGADMPLGRGIYVPAKGHGMFPSFGDSAPDTWGRQLMRRRERRLAAKQGRAVRTLMETDYLLGVSDEVRFDLNMQGQNPLRQSWAKVFQNLWHWAIFCIQRIG